MTSPVAVALPADTERLTFRWWRADDEPLARALWGDPRVAALITAGGAFTASEVGDRLRREIDHGARLGYQYWPVFACRSGELVGACGLKPSGDDPQGLELGFQLCADQWGKGYATEAARAVIVHAFGALGARSLWAGHHPRNERSRRTLEKLGFGYVMHQLYPPTGLMHPLYRLLPPAPSTRSSR